MLADATALLSCCRDEASPYEGQSEVCATRV